MKSAEMLPYAIFGLFDGGKIQVATNEDEKWIKPIKHSLLKDKILKMQTNPAVLVICGY